MSLRRSAMILPRLDQSFALSLPILACPCLVLAGLYVVPAPFCASLHTILAYIWQPSHCVALQRSARALEQEAGDASNLCLAILAIGGP